jgi:hypothetical protein
MIEPTKAALESAAQQFLRKKFPGRETDLQIAWDALIRASHADTVCENTASPAGTLGIFGGAADPMLVRLYKLVAIFHETIVEVMSRPGVPVERIVGPICERHREESLAKDIAKLFSRVLGTRRATPPGGQTDRNSIHDDHKVKEILLCHPNYLVVRLSNQENMKRIELTPAEFVIFATLALRLYCDGKSMRNNTGQPGMVADEDLGNIYEQFKRAAPYEQFKKAAPTAQTAAEESSAKERVRSAYYKQLKKSLARAGLASLLPTGFKELYLRIPAERIRLDDSFVRYDRKVLVEFCRVFGRDYPALPPEIAGDSAS